MPSYIFLLLRSLKTFHWEYGSVLRTKLSSQSLWLCNLIPSLRLLAHHKLKCPCPTHQESQENFQLLYQECILFPPFQQKKYSCLREYCLKLQFLWICGPQELRGIVLQVQNTQVVPKLQLYMFALVKLIWHPHFELWEVLLVVLFLHMSYCKTIFLCMKQMIFQIFHFKVLHHVQKAVYLIINLKPYHLE